MTAEDELHSSRIIACLVRRLGGQVVISAAELRDEPAALSTVGTLEGFEIKVIERDPPGPDLIDMGYVSRPVVSTDPMDPGGTWHGHNAPEPPPDWAPRTAGGDQ